MVLRAPGPDDQAAVYAVLAARDIADLGHVDITLEHILDEWRQSEFDLASDAVVIEFDGEVVAYAEVRGPGARVVVAPEHEGRGAGAQLLEWTENRARELGRDAHRQFTAASNRRAAELLVAAGYATERSYFRMLKELDDVDAEVTMPTGFTYRVPDLEADAAALHVLDIACFTSVPYYRQGTLTGFRERHLELHDSAPELSVVAESDGELAGFLLALRWQDEGIGFIDLLGVHPEHQRHGLGSALLRSAFARFAAAGLREAQLGVASDNPPAVALYERVGMWPRYQFDTYVRPIAGTAS
jgi:mycothiol synthase